MLAALALANRSPAPPNLTIGATANLDGLGLGLDVTGNILSIDLPLINSQIKAVTTGSLLNTTDLSVAAANTISVLNAISWNSAHSLTLSASTLSLGADIANTGTGALNLSASAITLTTATSLTGGAITFGGTVNGAANFTVNSAGTITFSGAVGGVTPLTQVSIGGTGGLALNGGAVTTSGTGVQSYGFNPVSLGADTTLTSTGGGAIGFAGTINGSHALTISTSGTTTFGAAIGATTKLTSLATSGSGAVAINGGAISTTGAQSYSGAATLGANTTLSSSAAGIALASISAGNNHSLTIDAATASTLGATTGLSSLTKNGAGTLTLSGANDFGGGTLINAGTLALGSGASLVTGGDVTLAANTVFSVGVDQTIRGLISSSSSSSVQLQSGKTLSVNLPSADDSAHTSATFNGKLTGAGSFALAGPGTLTLGGANDFTGTITVGGAGTLTVGSEASLAGASARLVVNSGTLNLNNDAQTVAGLTGTGGTINLGGHTLTVANTTSGTFSGTLAGNGGLAKSGSGSLTLSGTNTYHGGTDLGAGTLIAGTDAALGDGTIVLSGGTLQASGTRTLANAISVAGETGSTISGTSSLTLTGAIEGFGSLAKSGSGTLTLSGDNSDFQGSLTASAGTIALGSSTARGTGDWTFNNSSILQVGVADGLSYISDSTPFTFFNNTATLKATVSGAISGGEQYFNNSSVLKVSAANAITGGYQYFNNDSSGSAQLSVTVAGGVAGGSQTFGSTSSLQVSGTGSIVGGSQYFQGNSLLKAGVSNSIADVYEGDEVVSSPFAEFTDQAKLVASGANAIVGGTQIFDTNSDLVGSYFSSLESETLSGRAFSDFLTASDAPASRVTDFLNATAHLTVNGNGTGGISGGMQYFSGYSSLQANHSSAIVDGYQAFTDNSHLRASQADSVAGGFQGFAGHSFLWASATNAVTGGNQVFADSAGVYANATNSIVGTTLSLSDNAFIQVGADNALSNSTYVYFSPGESESSTGGTLTLNGHNTAVASIASGFDTLAHPGLVENGGATAATLTVGYNSEEETTDLLDFPATFRGVIRDGGEGRLSLEKVGTNTLTLAGANTYTGTTTINGGTLRLGIANALPTATALTLADIADVSFDLNNLSQTIGALSGGGSNGGDIFIGTGALEVTIGSEDSTTFGGQLVGSGTFTKSGNGQLVLTADSPFAGDVVIGAGTLTLGTGGATGGLSTDISIASGATLVTNRSNATTFANTLSGSGTIRKQGTGTLTVSGNSPDFAGAAHIEAGTLVLTGSVGAGSQAFVHSGGELAGTGNLGLLSVSLGGLLSPGGDLAIGTLHAGDTTLYGGAIFNFDFNATTGATGTYDLLTVAGRLTIDGSATTTPIFVNVNMLSPLTAGTFNATSPHSWQFVSTTDGIANFSANAFSFSAIPVPGSLSVGVSGNNLLLNFTPIPEPSTWALLAAGLATFGFGAYRRRRRDR